MGLALYARFREQLLYLAFGGLTTAVNLAVYYPLVWLGVQYQAATAIAWVAAVAFAYVTNRAVVFRSQSRGRQALAREALSFFAFRLLSLVAEMAVMWVGVEGLRLSENLVKLPAQVVVIVLNYVFSKLWVFARPQSGGGGST